MGGVSGFNRMGAGDTALNGVSGFNRMGAGIANLWLRESVASTVMGAGNFAFGLEAVVVLRFGSLGLAFWLSRAAVASCWLLWRSAE